MPVGIPGTVLGFVFYSCLVVCMPIAAAVQGLAGWSRWRSSARHVAILAAIYAVMWVEVWVMRAVADGILALLPANSAMHGTIEQAVQAVSPAILMLPFMLIGGIMLSLELLRMEVEWWETVRRQAQSRLPALPRALAA